MCAAAVLVLTATPSLAQERARVLLPLPADLDERLVGQTTDLAWTLERVPGPRPRDLDEAATRAEGARVVLWVETGRDGLRLHFADVRDRRLLVRDFSAPNDEAFGGSATLESVAVAVRSALQALSLGGEVGVAAPPPPPPDPEPIATPPPTPRAVEASLDAELGWWAALDGESPVQHGPTFRLGLRTRRLLVGLAGEVGLGAQLSDPLTQVSLTRHAALVDLGVVLLDRPRGGIELAARLGLARYRRGEVEPRVAGVVPAPAHTSTSALVGLRLGAEVSPRPRFALRLDLGVDVLPSAPTLRYADEAGNVTIRNDLWMLQPRAALSIVVRSHGGGATAREESLSGETP